MTTLKRALRASEQPGFMALAPDELLRASEQPGFMALAPEEVISRVDMIPGMYKPPAMLPQAVAATAPATPRPNPPVPQAAPVAATPPRRAPSPRPAPAIPADSGPGPQIPGGTDVLAGIAQRRMDYERQLDELSKPVDYTQLQSQMAGRQQSGERDMMASMLAGMGPRAVQGLQAPLARQASAQMGPLQVEGGMITPDGQLMMDPGFQQQRKVDAIRARLNQLDQMELRAFDMREKNEIARERNQIMLMVAAMRKGGGGDGAAGQFGGPAVVVGKDEQGSEVYRHTKSGQLFRYDQGGVPQPYQGDIFSKTPLPPSVATKLAGYEGQVGELGKLIQSWKPEFAAAYPGTGQAEIFAGKYLPGKSPDMANWWQNYQRWANLVRNSLFGSALTAHEKAAFDAANIGPNQKNELIMTNLQQQLQAVHEAHQKLSRYYRRNPGALGPMPTAPLPGAVSLPKARQAVNPGEASGGWKIEKVGP